MKRQFGRYVIADEVADELGRGAFGRVYRAFDPNVNRHVAVKVLSSGSDPDMLSRFRDESKTAGKLEHENIVKVYDFDLQDGMPYLVMELLEGETLESIIRSRMAFGRQIQLLDEVQIMYQVAAGLQYAHARNIIHRDIKPGNIMVLPNGTAKVMDFGIARMMDKGGTRLTRQGDIAGTILYMAPEQFKGCDADKRTDIFSYADVYYELLTGEHPFHAADPGTMMYRITAHDPPSIRERLPECPALLEAMIQRLMAKDREIRTDRLEEVIFDTQPILQGLRQERATVLVASIPALIEAGEQDSAQQAIRQVLELDPLNTLARRLRDQLLDARRREQVRGLVETLVREGEEQVASRHFNEAVQRFERASALDRSDAALQRRLGEVKLLCDNARKAARLLSAARAEFQQGQLEAALEKAGQAVGLDNGSQDAAQFELDVRKEIRDRRDASALAQAKGHRSRGEYAKALAVLDTIEDGSAAKIEAMLLRGMVERDRTEAEIRQRREVFEQALAGVRELLVSQRLDEALASADALCSQHPDEPEAEDLLCEVREHLAARGRMDAVGKITQAARGFVSEDRFGEALSTIEQGLHSYPGDTSLTRLQQVATALAAAQQRAEQISRIVAQTRALSSEGRLDEALLVIDRAIAEFGKEIALAERKRDLELERTRAEYAASLRNLLEQARSLLAAQQAGEAVELLEEAMFRFPGESTLVALRDEARAARAAAEERDFVSQTLSEAGALELAEQFGAATALLDAAVARYPTNPDLPLAAARMRQQLEEQARRRMLQSRIGRIEAAIQSRDWDHAASECEDAGRTFPTEEALAQFESTIREGKRRTGIRELQERIEGDLKRLDSDAAERQLAIACESFAGETVWQALRRDCELLRQYLDKLASAEDARSRKEYVLAEQMLRPMLADALDRRAAELLAEVIAARSAAEEETRRQEEDRRQRAAEAERRKRERAAIAKGRAEAAKLVRKADYTAAVGLLEQLAVQYPAAAGVQQDLAAAQLELERQRREQEEQASTQRDQRIAAQRAEAAELARNDDPEGAIALLDRLDAEFPGVPELVQDREGIVRVLEQQRRDAERQARLLREQAVAAGRLEASQRLSNGDASGAIAILERLAAEYPDSNEVRSDLETTAREAERRRCEAEEQARRERELAVIEQGRAEAAALIGAGDHQSAIALLYELATQFPGNPDIQGDRRAARNDWERQRREAKEQAARMREQAIATRRQEAAEALRRGEAQDAIALLDGLIADYPEVLEIRQDRGAALREAERLQREAEARARQERESAAIQEVLVRAAALVSDGDPSTAFDLLDQLAAQYPGDPRILADREAAWLAAENMRLAAEEQARRERESAAMLSGRNEAAALMRNDDCEAACALLDRLARQFPDDPGIAQDREYAAEALQRQHLEAEERARKALAAFSARRRAPTETAEPARHPRKRTGNQNYAPHPATGSRAEGSSAGFPAAGTPGVRRDYGGAATGGTPALAQPTRNQTFGNSARTRAIEEPPTASNRLRGSGANAISSIRNAIASLFGKGG